MPSQFVYGKNPTPPDATDIDTTKPYDIYCGYGAQPLVVYRNARFVGKRNLFCHGSPFMHTDPFAQFIELELANGQTVFVRQHSVMSFCEPGADGTPEVVAPKPVA